MSVRRSRHDDVLGTCLQVSLSLLLGQEQTGRFNDVLGAHLVPFQVRGIFLGRYADSLTVDDQLALLDIVVDRAVELAVHRIVLQHVSHVIHRYEVVDAHYFDLIVGACGTEHQTADTAETVDTNLNL